MLHFGHEVRELSQVTVPLALYVIHVQAVLEFQLIQLLDDGLMLLPRNHLLLRKLNETFRF